MRRISEPTTPRASAESPASLFSGDWKYGVTSIAEQSNIFLFPEDGGFEAVLDHPRGRPREGREPLCELDRSGDRRIPPTELGRSKRLALTMRRAATSTS